MFLTQAMIGIAFSIGYLFGPSIGAYFAVISRGSWSDQDFFLFPALFSLVLATTNLFLISAILPETLPKNQRSEGLSHVYQYLNPISLFKFSAVQRASRNDLSQLRKIGAVQFFYVFLTSGPEMTLTFLTQSRFAYDGLVISTY